MLRNCLWLMGAAWAFTGMVCVNPEGIPPTLPEARLTRIELLLSNPDLGRAGIEIAWEYPDSGNADYFEIYRTLRSDSLGMPLTTRLRSDTSVTVLSLPDTTLPVKVYIGVRAVFIEGTGQKQFGRTIPLDSLEILRALKVDEPAPAGSYSHRDLAIEVRTDSDPGIVLRQTLYEKGDEGWKIILDTCLPMDRCGIPVFGASVQRDNFVLQSLAPGDTVECLYCAQGDEGVEGESTGRKQALGCARFHRSGP